MEPAGLNESIQFSREPSVALEEMMKAYGNAVIRTAYIYTGDRHMAEDISQEVFVRAYRNWLGFRGESSVKTWLTRITVNLCRDRMKLKQSAEQPLDMTHGVESIDPDLQYGMRSPGTEEEVMRRLSRSMILQHVMGLPAIYREVLYLYYYLELSTREIAEAVDAPEGTVRGRIHRARDMLGQLLRKEGLER